MRIASIRSVIPHLSRYRGIGVGSGAVHSSRHRGAKRGVSCGTGALSLGTLEGEAFVELKRYIPFRERLHRPQSSRDSRRRAPISSMDDAEAESAYSALDRWLRARSFEAGGAKA